MAKFNRSMIRGINAESEESNESNGTRVGAGLLNLASKNNVKMIIEHIPRNLIDKNENNKYSIDGIDTLAWSIKEMGLLQPVHLSKSENGRYKILGGERRITAIDQLIEDPDIKDWDENTPIPAVVKDAVDIQLPLSEELKESLSIITTNKEARKYTDGDRLEEIRTWKNIIAALRKANVKSLPGGLDENGNTTDIQIAGEKTREIIAKTTGLSRGSVNKYEKVENLGSEEVKNALLSNEITVSTAEHLITKTNTQEEQNEILNEIKKEQRKVTPEIIETKISEKKPQVQAGTQLLNKKLKEDLKEIATELKKTDIYLDDTELEEYNTYIQQLKTFIFHHKGA